MTIVRVQSGAATVFGRSKKKGEKAAKPKKEKKAKPKKDKKEKKAKAKAKPKSKAPGVPVKKRPTDVYSVMLMLSLAFVLLACVFLFLELQIYDFPSNLTPWK